jgi:hypothetical protein
VNTAGSSAFGAHEARGDVEKIPPELRRLIALAAKQEADAKASPARSSARASARASAQSAKRASQPLDQPAFKGSPFLHTGPLPDVNDPRSVEQLEAELFGRVRTYRATHVPFVDLSSPCSAGWGRLLLAVVLLVAVLGMGYISLEALLKQYAVRDWTPTPAVVDASSIQVTTSRGRRGRTRTHHNFTVQYSYELAGTSYISRAVDMSSDPFRSYGYAKARLDEYPAGKAITAFYNPQNPSQAVLKTELLAQHGIFLIFVIPIIPWVIKFASDSYQSLIARVASAPAAGMPTSDDGTNLSITLPRHGVLNFTMYVWFGLLLAVSIYFLIYGVIIHTETSFWTMAGLFAATIPLALVAAAIKLSTIRSGSKDLSINRITREVMLPATFGRPVGVVLHLDRIEAVQTSDVMSRTKNGREYRSATKLGLITVAGEEKLAVWTDSRRADALGEYLARVLSDVKSAPIGGSGRKPMQPRPIV